MLPADTTILQVAPNDEGGGGEKVAIELHLAYLERGLDAWLALGANHDRVPTQRDDPQHRLARPVGARGAPAPPASPTRRTSARSRPCSSAPSAPSPSPRATPASPPGSRTSTPPAPTGSSS